jgi:hypothetical protein
MSANITENERRVFIGVRIHPNTKKFLKSMRAKNLGRAIDNLVTHHQAFLSVLQKRPDAGVVIPRSGPSELELPAD